MNSVVSENIHVVFYIHPVSWFTCFVLHMLWEAYIYSSSVYKFKLFKFQATEWNIVAASGICLWKNEWLEH